MVRVRVGMRVKVTASLSSISSPRAPPLPCLSASTLAVAVAADLPMAIACADRLRTFLVAELSFFLNSDSTTFFLASPPSVPWPLA